MGPFCIVPVTMSYSQIVFQFTIFTLKEEYLEMCSDGD